MARKRKTGIGEGRSVRQGAPLAGSRGAPSANPPAAQSANPPTGPGAGWLRGQPAEAGGAGRGRVLLAAGVIVVAIVGAYWNSFQGQMLFDDSDSIADNPNAHSLWPIWKAMWAPKETTVAGRPIGSLTVAVNYAVTREDPCSYHALNLAVHVLAALTVLGVVRRTLLSERLRGSFGRHSLPLAWSVALLWAVHPIQTESVTYIIQRVESLMGLFFLLTVYCAIRASGPGRPLGWTIAAVAASALGMASKEVMAAAPLVVVAYDYCFLPGSPGEVVRRRWKLYAGLAATWLVLIGLLATSPRPYSAGAGETVASPLEYAASQFGVIAHYLRLAFWPWPLCLDYGWPIARSAGEILPPAALIAALLGCTALGLRRRWAAGFAGAWFFLILAPTSSVLPILDLAFEHRMYLPLLGVVAPVVVGGYWLAARLLARPAGAAGSPPAARGLPSPSRPPRAGVGTAVGLAAATLAVAAVFGWLTWQRNALYASEDDVWADAIRQRPFNFRPHHNLGLRLVKRGQLDQAVEQFRRSIECNPLAYRSYSALGAALADKGQFDEAVLMCRKALEINPDYADAHYNHALALMKSNDLPGAVEQFRSAIQLNPNSARFHDSLGVALMGLARYDQAMREFQAALECDGSYAEAISNMGLLLMRLNRPEEAIARYREALRVRPSLHEAHYNMGLALAGEGRTAEAMEQFAEALRTNPGLKDAHVQMAKLLAKGGDFAGAADRLRQGASALGDPPDLLAQLAWLLATCPDGHARNGAEAVALARRACQATAFAHAGYLDVLAAAYAEAGDFDQAIATAERAIAAGGDAAFLRQARQRLALYKSHQAFHPGAPGRGG